jgi:exodeoxyribonuclease VII small subunit
MEPQQSNPTFEEAVVRLETIVTAMESGGLTLSESLRHFEEAIALSRACAEELDSAEKRIQVLSADATLREAVELGWTDS